MKNILLLYSYTYINTNGEKSLLYNTLSGDYFVIDNSEISQMLKQLVDSVGPNYILEFTDEISDDILNSIRIKKMGRVLKCDDIMPIQYASNININGYSPYIYSDGISGRMKTASDNYEKTILEKDYQSQMGKNIIDYFSILTVYYSGNQKINAKYAGAFKQYPFPYVGPEKNIDIDSLRDFLDNKSDKLEKINLVIGDIVKEDLDLLFILLSYLREKSCAIYVYSLVENQEIISKFANYIDIFSFWVLPDNSKKNFLLSTIDTEYLGLVTSHSEMEKYGENIEIYPYFTSSNKKFCMDESFFYVQNALEMKPTQNEVRASQFVNTNIFGELSILPNGDVYSCLQHPAIGNLYKSSLKEILYGEFLTFKNWFKVRRSISPCTNCIYNWICPPITNYEMALEVVLCDQVHMAMHDNKQNLK